MTDSKKIMTKRSKRLDKIKLEQYRRCSEDWRHMESIMFWHIPTIFIMLASVMLGAYGYLSEGLGRVSLLAITSLLMFVVNVSLAKHRLGSKDRAEWAGSIEEEYFGVDKIPIKTDDMADFLELKGRKVSRLVRKLGAYFVLQIILLSIFAIMIGLTVYEIINILPICQG